MERSLEARLVDEVHRELAFGRELVLLARRRILELDGDAPTMIAPLHLLSHGWERLLKTLLLLCHAHRGEVVDPDWARRFGHDVQALRKAFLDECCGGPDDHGMDRVRLVWGAEGDWLMESIATYATGSRYFGLDLMTQIVVDPSNVPPLPLDSDAPGDHPEDRWLDFYTWQEIDHGLATDEEIDDMDNRPMYGRLNVRIASLIEDQLQALVTVCESGRIGVVARDSAQYLRFARWTSVDF